MLSFWLLLIIIQHSIEKESFKTFMLALKNSIIWYHYY